MDKRYSDSLFPTGIGASFFSALVIMLSAGAIVGFFWGDRHHFEQPGGVFLLTIFLVLLAGPILYNKKKSRFELKRSVLDTHDGIGTIQGLRGAMFRLIIYGEGFEIRAFYHRYYIPFESIEKVSIEKGYISQRLNFMNAIDGAPDYIIASGQKFQDLASLIEKKVTSEKADKAVTKGRAND